MIPARISLLPVIGLMLSVGCSDTLSAQNNSFQASPSQLVFNMPQAGVLPSQSSAQLSLSTTLGTTVQYTTSAPAWLVVTPSSGTLSNPGTLTVGLSTAALSLSNASYTGAVIVSQAGTGAAIVAALSIPVTLNVGNQLVIGSSSTVNLTYQVGQTVPSATLSITSTGGSMAISIGSIQPAQSWLLPSVTPGATTPATVSVSTNPGGLTAGKYSGSFVISSTASGVTPITVTVNLAVTESPALTASPQQLSFSYQIGTATGALPARTVAVATDGGLLGFTVDPSPATWLTVVANGTVASQGQPATLTVTVNPNSPVALPNNTYTANIVVRPVGASTPAVTIPVTLVVSSSALFSIGAAPQPFTYQVNGTTPADQTVAISSSSGSLDYTVTSTPAWLTITPGAGSTNLVSTLTLHVLPSVLVTLTAGSYTGTVTISIPHAGNPTASFPVTLNVSFVPALTTSIAGLTFNYQTTVSQLPAAQYFTVNSTGDPLPVGTVHVASSTCGGNWLSAVTSQTSTPATVFVSVAPTGIGAPSACTGTATVPSSVASSLAVPITLNISSSPLLNVMAPDLTFTAAVGTTAPQQRTITLSSTDATIPVSFTVSSDSVWLTPSVATGRTDSTPSFTIFVNPSVLTVPGTYTANVTVTNQSANPAGSQPGQIVRVILNLTSTVSLSISPQTITATVPSGSAAVTKTVQVVVSADTAAFHALATTNQGGSWLKVSLAGGAAGTSVDGTAPASLNVTLDPTSLGLAAGVYTGQVTVSSTGLLNSPQVIAVTLTVGVSQTIGLNVSSITLSTGVGATSSVAGAFTITSAGGALDFTITKAATGCDAISVNPASGTTGGTLPLTIIVTLNPAGLAVGTSSCTLTISGPQGAGIPSQTLAVNVVVAAAAQPVIVATKNAASYAVGAVAPGEVLLIGGANLGPTTLAGYVLNPDKTFATTVGGTTVYFDSVPAPIVYTRSDITAVVVPFEIAGRATTNITVARLGQTSAALQMQVAQYAPGLFTVNQQGVGQGAIINQDGVTVNDFVAPAARGSVISIYLTGAGLMSYANQTGSILPVSPLPTLSAQTEVVVTVANQTCQVTYAGGAPQAIAGLYQINAKIPATAPAGPLMLNVTVGGVSAQSNVTVYVQ